MADPKTDPITPGTPAPTPTPAPTAEELEQERATNGRFVSKTQTELTTLKAELAALKATIAPPATAPPKTTAPSKYETEYAETLKKEIGDKYDPALDTLPVSQRIDTMKAVITALKGKVDPIIKEGSETNPGSPPPAGSTKPKSFLELQKAEGFRENLRDRGSIASIAKKLYKRK